MMAPWEAGMRQSGTRGGPDLLEETTWTPAKRNRLTHTFLVQCSCFQLPGFLRHLQSPQRKTVIRKVRPKTSRPSGLVRRAGAAPQTHSGMEGGEKDKQCQDRNKVYQYLITVGFFSSQVRRSREVNNYQRNTDGRLRVI